MASTWALNDPKARQDIGGAIVTTHNPNTKAGRDAIAGLIDALGPSGPIQTTIQNFSESVVSARNVFNGVQLQGEGKGFVNVQNGVQLQNQISEDVYRRLKYQYANLYIATGVGTVGQALGGINQAVDKNLELAAKNITQTLTPVSSFIGSTLYTLTGVMKDPVGALFELPNTVGSMMDRVNPGFKAKYTATYRKHNIDKLAEMPGQMFGSAQQLIRAVDNILAVPINLISDIYYGFMDLIGQINDFINGLFESLQKFFSLMIEGIFPGLTEFLTQLVDFAGQIGGIAQLFSGSSQILGFTNQIIQGANAINGFIQSPLDFAFAYAPPEVSTVFNYLQNPQQIINNLLPPQLSEAFANIQNITGFGFNGNMGFGLESVLQGFQGGVLTSILQGFATQFSILAPLFGNGQILTPNFYPNELEVKIAPDGTPYNVDPVTGQIAQINDPRQRPNYVPSYNRYGP